MVVYPNGRYPFPTWAPTGRHPTLGQHMAQAQPLTMTTPMLQVQPMAQVPPDAMQDWVVKPMAQPVPVAMQQTAPAENLSNLPSIQMPGVVPTTSVLSPFTLPQRTPGFYPEGKSEMPPPPPSPKAPPKEEKSNTWLWVLGGLGTLWLLSRKKKSRTGYTPPTLF